MAQNQRKKKQKTSSSTRDNGNLKVIMYIVLVVVGIAGAVSLGTAGGTTKTTTNSGVTVPGGVDAAEFQDVKVAGEALPQLPESGTDPAVGKAAPTLTGYDLLDAPSLLTQALTAKRQWLCSLRIGALTATVKFLC